MCKLRSYAWMAPRVFENATQVIYHTLFRQATEMCSSKSEAWRGYCTIQKP